LSYGNLLQQFDLQVHHGAHHLMAYAQGFTGSHCHWVLPPNKYL